MERKDYRSVSADGNARQHNGDVINNVQAIQRERSVFSYFDRKKKNKQMLKAAEEGQFIRLRIALEMGADPDFVRGADKRSALHVSAQKGYLECLDVLISRGADLNGRDKHQQTALLLACFSGHAEVCKTLIAARADPIARDRRRYAPLDFASSKGHVEICRMLVAAGADPNSKSEAGLTALHHASMQGRTKVCSVLIAEKADVNAKSDFGRAPIHDATQAGHVEICRMLIAAGADVNFETTDGFAVLSYARREEDSKIYDMLVKAGAEEHFDVNRRNNWYCNNCNLDIADVHFNCSVCNGGEYDLCEGCVVAGKLCPGEDHWLAKCFIKDNRESHSQTEGVGRMIKTEEIEVVEGNNSF